MKKYIIIILVMFLGIYIFGCGKKKEMSLEEIQEPLSIEALSALNATAPLATESKLEPLPPSGPYTPTVREIQVALKNAGYYTGAIDGKKGPLTKKAIEDFQKANGLKVDGIVGPKTWSVLNKHLNPTPSTTSGKI